MTELLLIRHGETEWNRQLRFQGQVDVPLNETGLEQARRIGQRLAAEALHAVCSSDLRRALQTAEPVALAHRQDVLADAGLREQAFGSVDGWSVAEIQAQHPALWADWLRFDADFAMPGGESGRQFHARVLAALRRVAAAHAGRRVAVATHGGVLDMVWRTATGQSLHGPREADIPNGGINRVRIGAAGGVEIVSWAEVDHLAGLPPQPVYDQKKLLAAGSSPSAA